MKHTRGRETVKDFTRTKEQKESLNENMIGLLFNNEHNH